MKCGARTDRLPAREKALDIVSRYKGVWSKPPENILTGAFTDAPLLGNGDVGVILAGDIRQMEFYLGKNEFFSQNEGIPKAMSRIQLQIPDLEGASYNVEQRLLQGEVSGRYGLGEAAVTTRSWVQATDTQHNQVVTKLTYTGTRPCAAVVRCFPGIDNSHNPSMGWEALSGGGVILYQDVRADWQDVMEGYETPKARVAVRFVGDAQGTVQDSALKVTLQPGAVCYLVFAIVSVYDHSDYQEEALRCLAGWTPETAEARYAEHCGWWADFWGRSYVEIPQKDVEEAFYGSLYLLACCMRAGEASPTLYGNWVMQNMRWGGTPPLNYNYEAPYLCTVPTNHEELADNYEALLFQWMDIARQNAREHGYAGLYYEAYPGPLPYGAMFSATRWKGLDYLGRDCYMGQKSNGAFAAVNMVLRYFYTRDAGYASYIYPFLKEVGDFWLAYLRWDGARYVIVDDYVHEGPVSLFPQTNPLTSLGFVRLLFQGLLAMAEENGWDLELQAKWRDRLEHLSAYPVFCRQGQWVFRNQEVGESVQWSRENGYEEDFSEWSTPCAVPEMLLYPGGQIGAFSDPQLLDIARHTVAQQAKWRDANMTCFFYPAAVRVGHDRQEIAAQLSGWLRESKAPNMTLHAMGGGLENLNTVPATLVEMLCQSYEGRLWVFPHWPAGWDAQFGDLLAYGNFLVSSQFRGGAVQYVQVVSQKGRPLRLLNPWSAAALQVYRDGAAAEKLEGAELYLHTREGEVLWFAPAEVSYEALRQRMTVSGE